MPESVFDTVWPIRDQYQIISKGEIRVLTASNGIRKTYNPSSPLCRGIVSAFAKLKGGREQEVLMFANEYGLLDGDVIEFNVGEYGDPLIWIEDHAKAVHLYLSLIEQIEDKNGEKIKDLLKKFQRKNRLAFSAPVVHGVRRMPFPVPKNEDEWIEQATVIVKLAVNLNVSPATLQLAMLNDTRDWSLSFSALLQVIYWQLGNSFGARNIRHCEECSAFFIQENMRQRFCPKGLNHESACAVRARGRRRPKKTLKRAT